MKHLVSPGFHLCFWFPVVKRFHWECWFTFARAQKKLLAGRENIYQWFLHVLPQLFIINPSCVWFIFLPIRQVFGFNLSLFALKFNRQKLETWYQIISNQSTISPLNISIKVILSLCLYWSCELAPFFDNFPWWCIQGEKDQSSLAAKN